MKTANVASLVVLLLAFAGCARPHLWSTPEMKYPGAMLVDAERVLETEQDGVFKGPADSRNVTTEFTALFHDPQDTLSPERLALLQKHKILLVHGLLGEVGLGVRRFLDKIDSDQVVIDYFKDQEAVFREHGIDFERVEFRSNTVDRSGGKIVEAVLRSGKPVLFFSHSKGCVDTLDALLKLQAQGQLDRVAGWIALQGVFAGAPHAEHFVKHGGLRTFGIAAMRIMGGDFDAIRDLTPEARAKYHAEHAEEIRTLVERLPVISFATWETPEKGEPKDTKGLTNDEPLLTSAFKIQPESSILSGSDYVGKAGINHNVTVIRSSKLYDRPAMTRALLAMLADRVASRCVTER
jgi:hypothetical protein